MATVVSSIDDTQNQNPQGQGQGGGINQPGQTAPTQQAPSGSQSGGLAVAGGGGSQPTKTVSPVGTSSGSYNNLQKYLDANSSFNQQQGGLAGQVAGNINQQAQQQQQNVNAAGNAFTQQAQQATNAFTNPNLVNQALANPYQFTQNPNNVQQFNQIANATYTGPNSLQDLQGSQNLANLQTQQANLTNNLNQAQTEPGRFALLQQMFGNNSYNQGQQNLDNLLLQNNPGQMQQIQGARQMAAQTGNQLNQTEQQAQATATTDKAAAANIANTVQGQLNQAVGNINTNLNQQAQAAQAQQQQDLNSLYQNAVNGQLTQSQQALLGSNPNQVVNELAGLKSYNNLNSNYQQLAGLLNAYGISPSGTDQASQLAASLASNFSTNPVNLTQGGQLFTTTGTPTQYNVASANDYNNLLALNQLMGGNATTPGALATTNMGNVLAGYLPNVNQGGTYNVAQDVGLNNPALGQMVSGATGNIQAAEPILQNLYNTIQNTQGLQFTGVPGQPGVNTVQRDNSGSALLSQIQNLINQGNKDLPLLAGNNPNNVISGVGPTGTANI